jgi:hypothetical protein
LFDIKKHSHHTYNPTHCLILKNIDITLQLNELFDIKKKHRYHYYDTSKKKKKKQNKMAALVFLPFLLLPLYLITSTTFSTVITIFIPLVTGFDEDHCG